MIGHAEERRVMETGVCERWLRQIPPMLMLVLFALAFFLVLGSLALKSGPQAFMHAAYWFDPVFFQYNLFLLGFAVFVIPAVTWFYAIYMKGEKFKRLRNQLPAAQWQESEAGIRDWLARQSSPGAYFGSMTVLMLVVTFGASIMLLLKPVLGCAAGSGDVGCGVDYSRGANILLLGPYIELYANQDRAFFQHIVISLTAFQFGFLGAYVYFIGRLARDYFTLDLTSHTYVAATIRIVTASLLSLVISFFFGHLFLDKAAAMAFLPVLSFFFGHFPEQALTWLRKRAAKVAKLAEETYRETPLSVLPGMNYYHEVRLGREGYDNAENLANAHPVDLALRTGFGYRQLRTWIGQAWLLAHLGEADYRALGDATAVTGPDELQEFLKQGIEVDFEALFCDATGRRLSAKIQSLRALLPGWQAQVDRRFELEVESEQPDGGLRHEGRA